MVYSSKLISCNILVSLCKELIVKWSFLSRTNIGKIWVELGEQISPCFSFFSFILFYLCACLITLVWLLLPLPHTSKYWRYEFCPYSQQLATIVGQLLREHHRYKVGYWEIYQRQWFRIVEGEDASNLDSTKVCKDSER